MTTHEHHEELLGELAKHLKEILEGSSQAVYVYLDDTHKICNQHFADLLGYASPDEWAAVTDPFPQVFVAEGSQSALVGAFQQAIEEKAGSTLSVNWLKKDKSTVDTTVILVPISFGHHLFALHFVAKK
jgi:hypothetical protein